MAKDSKIEWTTHTFNPWWGCVKVSDGCKNCYAEAFSKRTGNNVWGVAAERRFFGEKHWNEPLKWNEAAKGAVERPRVFCASMADVFELLPGDHPSADAQGHAQIKLFPLIMQTPHLDWMLLTKRPEHILKMIEFAAVWCFPFTDPDFVAWLVDWVNGKPPHNVWLGTSVEDNRVIKRVHDLIQTPAVAYFLSCEPVLGEVTLPAEFLSLGTQALVIAGGESGANPRPMHPAHPRSLRDQCQAHGVPFHFKQWGEYMPAADKACPILDKYPIMVRLDGSTYPATHNWNALGQDAPMLKVGKKAAGRLLDGRTWDEMPTPLTPAPDTTRAADLENVLGCEGERESGVEVMPI